MWLLRIILKGYQNFRWTNICLTPITGMSNVPTTMKRSVGYSHELLSCWLDGSAVSSLPDTGAEINIKSSSFASKLKPETRNNIDNTDRPSIPFADCSVKRTLGRIDLTLTLSKPDHLPSSMYQLLDSPAIPKMAAQINLLKSRLIRLSPRLST